MDRIIIKKSISNLLVGILGLGLFWFYYILCSGKSGAEIVSGFIVTILVAVILLIQCRMSIVIESNRIVLHRVFTIKTIGRGELLEVKVKQRSIIFIKINGIKYELLFNGFKKADIVFMKSYFEGLQMQISMDEGEL